MFAFATNVVNLLRNPADCCAKICSDEEIKFNFVEIFTNYDSL